MAEAAECNHQRLPAKTQHTGLVMASTLQLESCLSEHGPSAILVNERLTPVYPRLAVIVCCAMLGSFSTCGTLPVTVIDICLAVGVSVLMCSSFCRAISGSGCSWTHTRSTPVVAIDLLLDGRIGWGNASNPQDSMPQCPCDSYLNI